MTDGRGGYGCGTALDLPMRRYHSWLTAVPAGQVRRVRFLSGVDERVRVGATEQGWSAAHWAGEPAADDPEPQCSFTHDPVPTWIRRAGECELTRELLMPRGHQAVIVRWRNSGSAAMQLSVRPLLDCVDADELGRERGCEVGLLPSAFALSRICRRCG